MAVTNFGTSEPYVWDPKDCKLCGAFEDSKGAEPSGRVDWYSIYQSLASALIHSQTFFIRFAASSAPVTWIAVQRVAQGLAPWHDHALTCVESRGVCVPNNRPDSKRAQGWGCQSELVDKTALKHISPGSGQQIACDVATVVE